MILTCLIYTDLNGEECDDCQGREFFKSANDAIKRYKELRDKYSGADYDFYMDNALYRIEYQSSAELVEKLNMLNKKHGKKYLSF